VLYGTGRALRRGVPSRVALYVLEALEPRMLMTAGTVPTPLYESVPLVVATKHGLVVGVAMSDGSGSYLTRFTDQGQIDRSFGNDGAVILAEQGSLDTLEARPDGGLVLLMEDYNVGDVSIVELDPTGRLDATFGTSGSVRLPFRSLTGCAMTLMDDGRVVVAEPLAPEPFPDPYGPADAIGLYRFTASGELDGTFGEAGVQRLSVPRALGYVQSVRAGPTGELSLLASPWEESGIWLMKTDASGAPELGLDQAGMVNIGTEKYPYCDMLEDGTIIQTEFFSGINISRFTGDGKVDQSFGSNGALLWSNGYDMWTGAPTLQLPNGTLVVSYISNGTKGADHLLALNADGSPLATFGAGDGIATVPRPGDNWRIWDFGGAVVDDAGRIVTASYLRQGNEEAWGEWRLAISRFNADGTLDTTFAGTGSVFLPTEVMNAPQPPAATIVPKDVEAVAEEPAIPIVDSVQANAGVFNARQPLNPVDDSMVLLSVKSEEDFLGRISDDLFAA
jgi:uncharacterized delta-60 repeat protein